MKTLKNNIYILCGFSSCGKDSLLEAIAIKKALNINPMVSYTSRPKRDKEEDGREYNFVSKEEFIAMIDNDEVVEYKTYNTLINGIKDKWYYGTSTKSIDTQRDNIVVLDSKGAIAMKKIYGDKAIVIYIDVEDSERERRAKKRGSFNQVEWDRRLKDDCNIFSSEIQDTFEYRIENIILNDTINAVVKIIKEN